MRIGLALIIAAALAATAAPATARHPEHGHEESQNAFGLPAELEEPARVVDGFHDALARGDTAGALAFLAEDALIYESGGVERDRAEYAAHHLGADAAFAQAVPSQVTRRAGAVRGDIAWLASEGRVIGTFNDRALDRITTETIVLERDGGSWRIAHIHWSSAAAPSGS